ncbi:MAG: hypothetical protein COB10_06555, partial [Planctomycetota bacterium]
RARLVLVCRHIATRNCHVKSRLVTAFYHLDTFLDAYLKVYADILTTVLRDGDVIINGIDVSPEGIGGVGMLLNFAVAFTVHRFTGDAPQEVQDLVENLFCIHPP